MYRTNIHTSYWRQFIPWIFPLSGRICKPYTRISLVYYNQICQIRLSFVCLGLQWTTWFLALESLASFLLNPELFPTCASNVFPFLCPFQPNSGDSVLSNSNWSESDFQISILYLSLHLGQRSRCILGIFWLISFTWLRSLPQTSVSGSSS